jgi:catechol 2,3-dioxygenase-like lactoylglutathione lyase family enzyme
VADESVLSLEHVTVTTPEELEEEVLQWYSDVLGLERIDKSQGASPGGGWFQIGDRQLHLLIDPHNPPKNAHFCLRVADLDAFVGKLRAKRCHIEQAAQVPGRKRCFTRDPAGNSIEIVAFEGAAG